MLALPVSSAECERIFSSAKLLITTSRNRLNLDIIEANECLRAWFGRPEEGKKKVEEGDKVDQNEDGSWGEVRENEDENGESDQESYQESDGEADGETDEETDKDE